MRLQTIAQPVCAAQLADCELRHLHLLMCLQVEQVLEMAVTGHVHVLAALAGSRQTKTANIKRSLVAFGT